MRVLVLTGSPRGSMSFSNKMALAYAEEATKAGHEVTIFDCGGKNIGPCKACNYCHTKGEGVCIQKDDMAEIAACAAEAEALILASPIYYFTLTAQLQAAIHRFYCMGKLPEIKKIGLILSSGSPDVYAGAVDQAKGMCAYFGCDYIGAVTAFGAENGTEEKIQEAKDFAAEL